MEIKNRLAPRKAGSAMANPVYMLNVRWTGNGYEVTIPEIGRTAVATTLEEVIKNGHRAISLARREALRASKKPRCCGGGPHPEF